MSDARAFKRRANRAGVFATAVGTSLFASHLAAQQVEQVEVENVFRQREGYVPVQWDALSASPIAVGLAEEQPRIATPGVRFGQNSVPILCSTPCTMYLRPGVQRMVGEPDRPHIWAADVMVGATGSAFQLRGHRVGFSALGGAMIVVGLGAAVLGPGVIVVNLVVGTSVETRNVAILAGAITGLIGGGLIAGGWFTLQAGMPSVTQLRPRSSPRRAARSLRAWPAVMSDGSLGVVGVF